jgi:hypothetical protein
MLPIVLDKADAALQRQRAQGPKAMTSFADRVPLPPRDKMNIGLSACRESTMLKRFGQPGKLTKDCSPATGKVKKLIVEGVDVGPFKVSGMNYAVESLRQVLDDVKQQSPEVYNAVKTVGMICVRGIRHNPTHYSNHSWGTAIDIYFGKGVLAQGVHLAQRGNYLLFPFFNHHGWYWGAGFSGDAVDSMHFELAEETILKMPDGN